MEPCTRILAIVGTVILLGCGAFTPPAQLTPTERETNYKLHEHYDEMQFGALLVDCHPSYVDSLPQDQKGAMILLRGEGMVAIEAGFLPYDCIVNVDGTTIESTDDFADAIHDRSGEEVCIQFLRGRQQLEKCVVLGRSRPKAR